jgi:hypothetical protein
MRSSEQHSTLLSIVAVIGMFGCGDAGLFWMHHMHRCKTSMHANQPRSTLFLKVTVIGMFGAPEVADLRALRFSLFARRRLTSTVIHAFTSNLPERVCSNTVARRLVNKPRRSIGPSAYRATRRRHRPARAQR